MLLDINPPKLIRSKLIVDNTSTATNGTNLTTYNFPGLSFGAAGSAARPKSMVVCAFASSVANLVSGSIGGVAGNVLVNTGDLAASCGMMIAPCNDASGEVIVTWSDAATRCGIGVFSLFNNYSVVPTQAKFTTTVAANALNQTINVAGGGAVIAMAGNNETVSATWTWTGITENFDVLLETTRSMTGGSQSFDLSRSSLSVTAQSAMAITSGGMVIASFR